MVPVCPQGKHPDVVERYNNEILRVFGVLDGVLAKDGYLVEGRLEVADLPFISWNHAAVTKL